VESRLASYVLCGLYCDVCVDGVFLNMSTIYAHSGSGYVVPSACAKAGVEALTRYCVDFCTVYQSSRFSWQPHFDLSK